MFVPVSVLIGAGLVVLLLLALLLRPRRRDPLMGGQPPIARTSKPAAAVTTLPPETEAEVRALLAAGRKIEAIKLARDAAHLGLKQAKDLVESMER
ncbi:ribosomal protein L7/L12 [Sphingomonas sp. DG1-23]|uniref:ribosomal protein L7/L12 n=1 Tax=Sphingomonas sp. DG1-23 TaxID=3068316 RepID=UPI00273FB5FC|nr:ribosomal protein L7/L12 [Sphingomonas sp. DG1-23]MDP5277550.1 ribosomal protein L7/L12 [Sphingomonas sp. DG1-23]